MIQVVNRALDIIEYVAKDAKRPKLLGEMAANLGLNAATCANIVKTLLVRGYLEKSTVKGYLLGKNFYDIIESIANFKDIITAAESEMEQVTLQLKENTLLAILQGERRLIIHKKTAPQLVQAQTTDDKNAFDSSTGRVLIAMMGDIEIEDYLKKYGLPTVAVWKEASTKKRFLQQVDFIRKQGYALIEDTDQITGIAVPIYCKSRVVAAFSIYVPSFRYTNQLGKKMVKVAIQSAKNISLLLK